MKGKLTVPKFFSWKSYWLIVCGLSAILAVVAALASHNGWLGLGAFGICVGMMAGWDLFRHQIRGGGIRW